MTMVFLVVMDSWISGDVSADVLLSPLLRFIVVTLFICCFFCPQPWERLSFDCSSSGEHRSDLICFNLI
jgi:hypothetical protein